MDFLESSEWKEISKKIKKRDKKCLRCGSKYKLCTDHIIPRSRRYDLRLEEFNLQTLCRDCNRKKFNKYIVSFLKNPSQRLLKEIEEEKIKIRNILTKVARKRLLKKTQSSENFKKFVSEYQRIAFGTNDSLQKDREGILHEPLNILRFFGGGFSMLGIIGLGVFKSVHQEIEKNKIPDGEVTDYVDNEINKIFSDWTSIYERKEQAPKQIIQENHDMTDEEIRLYWEKREKEDSHFNEDMMFKERDMKRKREYEEEESIRKEEYKRSMHKSGHKLD